MKNTVYLDATVPSYYFDKRESIAPFKEITRNWWTEMSQSYDLYVSDAVVLELNEGNYPNKEETINLVAEIPLLPSTSGIASIADFYAGNFVMPKSLYGDAIHLAYASFYGINFSFNMEL